MSRFDFDLFVIGGGSGGVRAARIAAGHGARVALAEEYRLGGTCVIRGCVPKKLLVYASRYRDHFEDAAGFGWTLGDVSFDWFALIAAKDREIARLEGVYRRLLEGSGVTVFDQRAEFADANTLRLAEGRAVTAGKVLIATGGKPVHGPTIPGLELAITSNEAFDLERLPGRIVIYGAGYIALEFACLFRLLGSEVTIVLRGDQILRGFDEDLRTDLRTAIEARGIRVLVGRTIASLARDAAGIAVALSDGATLHADQVMFAIGRSPNCEGLGLDRIGVERAWSGQVVIGDTLETNVPGVFAIGDATDRLNLTPTAIREGHAFADQEFGHRTPARLTPLVPTAVFSTPEIATVGLTEAEARERCGAVDIYKTRFRPMQATLGGREERTLMKLVVDADSGRVVGCHMLGEDAAEIVQTAAIAIGMGATKSDFDATLALHPTAAEELVTLRQKWLPPTA